MTTYVFLGPSLAVEQATQLLDAVYLPPIQQGDLLRLLDRNPLHVGIVDGYFETVPAVWHKEILLAMSKGVHVFGAASMGAIRAAELHSFGMVGIGTIFEWYRDGKITADDEVAVRHGPAELGYLALSQALVDIRDSCAAAQQAGIIDGKLAEKIIEVARKLPYWDRSYETVAAQLYHEGQNKNEIDAWLGYAKEHYKSLKARDAAALLTEMQKHVAQPWTPKKTDFVFERTIFIERLINEIALAKALKESGSPPAEAPRDREQPPIDNLRRETLLRIAARQAAAQLGWEPGADEIIEEVSALCNRLGLADTQSLQVWMEQSAISEQMLAAYIADELFTKRLTRKFQVEIDRELPVQVRIAQACQRGAACGNSDST